MTSVKPSPLTITFSRSSNPSQPDCPEETRVLFGRWASVVPVDGTPYCHFSDATGPLRALVLPSASQVRERYEQAMAFMRQQASKGSARTRLCHSVSIAPPSIVVDRQIFFHNAELGECPSNDKCPKPAEIQSTDQVGENLTVGTNTHCVDSSSHADLVDRHAPIVPDNPDRDNVCAGGNLGNRRPKMSLSQGTDTATVTAAESAATSHGTGSEPRLSSTTRPARAHRRPARYLERVLAWPAGRACARRTTCGSACGDTAAVSYRLADTVKAHVVCPAISVDCCNRRCGVEMSTSDTNPHTVAGDLPPLASGDGTGAIAPFVHPRAGTRSYHEPDVHFPPQRCHACTSEEVFYTRTSFTNHLKGHGLFWKKMGEYAQLRQGKGSGGPAARGVNRSPAARGGPAARVPLLCPATHAVRPTPPPLMSISFPASVGAVPPHFTDGLATLPQPATVTSVTAFPQFPGPRPLLPDPGDERRRGVATPGRSERSSSPPTHDFGPQPEVPVSTGGLVSVGDGSFPPVGVRRTDTVTTTSTGVGRGVLIRATVERDLARRRAEAARPHVHLPAGISFGGRCGGHFASTPVAGSQSGPVPASLAAAGHTTGTCGRAATTGG